jgi:hypothetical protein
MMHKKCLQVNTLASIFIYYIYSTLLYLPPLRFPVSEGAGLEPKTVATLAWTVGRFFYSNLSTRLDLIYNLSLLI